MYLPRAKDWCGDFYFAYHRGISLVAMSNQRQSLWRTPVRQRWQGSVPLSVYFFVCYVLQGFHPRTPTTFWVKGGQI